MVLSSPDTGRPVLEMSHVAKSFGGVKALVDASLTLYAGEAHALLGENGAGKSTLLKTLAGVHRADLGEITLHGKPFEQGSTKDSIKQGIAVIYQEPSLFPDLTLAENVFIGRQLTSGGLVDWPAMERESRELFARLGVNLDPHQKSSGYLHCGSADCRNRQGLVHRCSRDRDGRTDRRTVVQGSGATVFGGEKSAGAG